MVVVRAVAAEGAAVGRESEQQQGGSSSAASSLSEDLAQLRAVVDRLTARDLTTLEGAAAAELVAELQAVEDRLTGVRVAAVAVCEADGLWAVDGTARTFAQWLARRTGVTVARAKRDARLGRALRDELPATAAAVRDGRVGVDSARILATVAATSEVRREALAGDWECNEAFLLQQAGVLDADRFRTVVRHWAAVADPEADERGFRDAAAREFLELSRTMGGFHLAGFLTDEHGLALTTALSAVAGVPPAGDDRSVTQRRAQALADLARVVLDRGLAGAGSAVRPHLSVHVTFDQLMAIETAGTGAGADTDADGTGEGQSPVEEGDEQPRFTGAAFGTPSVEDAESRQGAQPGTDEADCGHAASPPGLPAPPWPGGPAAPPPVEPTEPPSAAGSGPSPRTAATPGAPGEPGAPAMPGPSGVPARPFPPITHRPARTVAQEQWSRDPYPDEQRRPAPFRRTLPTPVTFEDGTPVPKSLLARLACDSEVTRIVFGPDATVLDVGRAKRTVTGQLRRAVIARDRHCAYPNCTAPPALGEVHHVQHWADGGLTSLINSILLCWHHHDLIHRRGITITRRGNTWVFTDHNGSLIGTTSIHAAA